MNFDFWDYLTLENVKRLQKFKIHSSSNGQNGSFWGFKMNKIDFMYNIGGRKMLKVPHCAFSIKLPRSVKRPKIVTLNPQNWPSKILKLPYL